jgi:hypothetical protein
MNKGRNQNPSNVSCWKLYGEVVQREKREETQGG